MNRTVTVTARMGMCLLLFVGAGQGCDRFAAPPPLPPASTASEAAPVEAPPPARRRPRMPLGGGQARQIAASELPVTPLPTYEIETEPNALDVLGQDPFSNEGVPAVVIYLGKRIEDARLRHRGAWARTWPKKPLKMTLPKGSEIRGQRVLNLNSAWRDPSFVREHLAYRIFTDCGVPAPQTRLVRVVINGNLGGLFVEVEQPEKQLLQRLGFKGATLIKANSQHRRGDERPMPTVDEYGQHYELETRKEDGFEGLHAFCTGLAQATNIAAFVTANVDLEKYTSYLAACVLVQHWDGYNKNHFLVYDGQRSKKWFVMPWDVDRTLGDSWTWTFDESELPIFLGTREMPGVTGWNRLQEAFLRDPTLRAHFLGRLRVLLQTEFTLEKWLPIIDALERDLAVDASLDRSVWPSPEGGELKAGMEQLRSFFKRRREFLLGELSRLN